MFICVEEETLTSLFLKRSGRKQTAEVTESAEAFY